LALHFGVESAVHIAFCNTGIKDATKIPISPETPVCLALSSVLMSNHRCFLVKTKKTGAIMKLQVVVHPAEEGGFWAEIPAFAGCVSEGETVEETLSNIKEAAEGWLEHASMRIKNNNQTQIAEIEL
jgi:predicted RNase H-like HicB family nuclease